MEQIDRLFSAGHEAQVFLREMTRHLRALLIVNVIDEDAASFLQITKEDETRYRRQAAQFSQERLIRIMNGFMTAGSELRYASSPRIGLEIAALKACRDAIGEDTTALLERVSELEIRISELPKTIGAAANQHTDPQTRGTGASRTPACP